MLKKRLLSAALLISISLLAVAFSHTVPGAFLFLALVDLFIAAAMYEFYLILEKKTGTKPNFLAIAAGVIYATMVTLTQNNPILRLPHSYLAPFAILLMILFTTILVIRQRITSAINDLLSLSASIVLIAWLFSYVARINYFEFSANLDSRAGSLYLLLAVAVVKGGDSFAYLFGHHFGKRKLSPLVSPNKTIAGALGQVAGGVAIMFLGKLLLPLPGPLTVIQCLVAGSVLSIVAQLGDLTESIIKRDAGVKDSSANLPGLGGILDVLDSLLFALPVMYYLMRFWLT